MEVTDVQSLIGRVISDQAFANSLSANPEQTLKDAGVDVTPEMLDALKGLDPNAIQRLATAFNSPTGAA